MKAYRHVFFDLDRTLWDFESNSREALSELYLSFDLQSKGLHDADAFRLTYERINEDLWRAYRIGNLGKKRLRSLRFSKTLETFGCTDIDLGRRLDEAYIDLSPHKTALVPNAVRVLDYLKEKYILHIITNGFEEVQHLKIAKSGLGSYFTEVITSERASARKPQREIFELAFSLTGSVAKESIIIGDDLATDIAGARNMEMDQVYFNPGGSMHSDKVTHEIKDLIELRNFL